MDFKLKFFLFLLLYLFSFSFVIGQEKTEDDGVIYDPSPVTVVQKVSVWSDKKGYLEDLKVTDFLVYDERKKQKIEFFVFDERTNQYIIGFSPKDTIPSDNSWHNVKIKLKLSTEKKKEYGEILISGSIGYFPNQN